MKQVLAMLFAACFLFKAGEAAPSYDHHQVTLEDKWVPAYRHAYRLVSWNLYTILTLGIHDYFMQTWKYFINWSLASYTGHSLTGMVTRLYWKLNINVLDSLLQNDQWANRTRERSSAKYFLLYWGDSGTGTVSGIHNKIWKSVCCWEELHPKCW